LTRCVVTAWSVLGLSVSAAHRAVGHRAVLGGTALSGAIRSRAVLVATGTVLIVARDTSLVTTLAATLVVTGRCLRLSGLAAGARCLHGRGVVITIHNLGRLLAR